MKLVIGSDHAGFSLKEEVRAYLGKAGHEVVDLGAYNTEPSDYPDFAEKVGLALQRGDVPRGILICGSGVGVCVAANKIPGIRAGHVPRYLLGAPGRGARRYERAGAGRSHHWFGAGIRDCGSVSRGTVLRLRKNDLCGASIRYWPSKQSTSVG